MKGHVRVPNHILIFCKTPHRPQSTHLQARKLINQIRNQIYNLIKCNILIPFWKTIKLTTWQSILEDIRWSITPSWELKLSSVLPQSIRKTSCLKLKYAGEYMLNSLYSFNISCRDSWHICRTTGAGIGKILVYLIYDVWWWNFVDVVVLISRCEVVLLLEVLGRRRTLQAARWLNHVG